MHERQATGDQIDRGGRQPYRLRLPGFVTHEDVGLGDVLKRATSAVGVTPCGSCARRAATLNRWLALSGRRPR